MTDTAQAIQAFGIYVVIPMCISIVIVQLVDGYMKGWKK